MSHSWYKLAVWREIRQHQLTIEPLCRLCGKRGIVKAANTVDHHPPHGGNWDRFINGPFRSLCASCHSGSARIEQARGYSTQVGPDGRPVDPNHPFNK